MKPHYVALDYGDPSEKIVMVTVNAEDGEVIDIIEMFELKRRVEAEALAHRLAKVFALPLNLIEHYGAAPQPVMV